MDGESRGGDSFGSRLARHARLARAARGGRSEHRRVDHTRHVRTGPVPFDDNWHNIWAPRHGIAGASKSSMSRALASRVVKRAVWMLTFILLRLQTSRWSSDEFEIDFW